MSFLLSLFGAVAVQKNIRDMAYFPEEENSEKSKLSHDKDEGDDSEDFRS